MRSHPSHSFLNPDPIACLVGQSNEAPVIVYGQSMNVLINFGAQVSSIRSGFCEYMTLKVYPLIRLLELEVTIPYLGYLEVNPQILGIEGHNEDALMLVIPTTTYSEKVPAMVGSKIIDRVMGNDDKGGTHKGNCDQETGPLWCSHVKVTLAAMHRLKGKWGSGSIPPHSPILQHPRSSAWMMSGDLSVPLGRLPFPCLGSSAYMVTQASEDTACKSTCLLSQHKAPSCPPLWY